jgi:L-ascorbate metabolism protein UlaG (beta-lactamase superfamily)
MRIIWHGHSCFEVRDGAVIVTDPHDGKSIGIKPPVLRADLVLVSHDHFDHNCTRMVKSDFVTLREPGERFEKGVHVYGLPAFHDQESGAKRGKIVIFKFIVDGVSFCHCGDLGHVLTDEMVERIGHVDFLFVPVGGVFTLDATGAKELIAKICPRIAVPMHFRIGGLSLSIEGVEPFLKGIPEERIVRVGNEVEFSAEELPEGIEYWVFSP